jgi:hypothetical protein
MTLITQKAKGVSILVAVAKLLEPTVNSATDKAMMKFFDVGEENCRDAVGSWGTEQDRTDQVDSSTQDRAVGKELHRVSPHG